MKNINFKTGFKRLLLVLATALLIVNYIHADERASLTADFDSYSFALRPDGSFTFDQGAKSAPKSVRLGALEFHGKANIDLPSGFYYIRIGNTIANNESMRVEKELTEAFIDFLSKLDANERKALEKQVKQQQSDTYWEIFSRVFCVHLIDGLIVAVMGVIAFFIARFVVRGFTKKETAQ